ncbi:MAG: hypothetical protein ACFE7R_10400 [Candidatus Hodarchaeota archaeon]
MFDFSYLQKQARQEVKICLQAWTEILNDELGDRIDYVYSKGSAMKKWDSAIDYVPVISDVDIHILLKDQNALFSESEDAFTDAMRFSKRYEDIFFELEPNPLHFPRSQLIHVNEFLKEEGFVPPRVEDVKPVIGTPRQNSLQSSETIRQIDLSNLLKLKDYLDAVPMVAVDRAGFDFWSLIRRMLWKVSPAPVRVITQSHEDPLEVWTWNRTKIASTLDEIELSDIAEQYRGFYEAGWDLFLSNMTSRDDYRRMVEFGYRVLRNCYEKAKELDSQ